MIQENLSLFEKTSLDPISELERVELLKQLIDSFPKNHPLKRYRGDVYFEIHNLRSLFTGAFKKGDTRTDKIEEEKEKMERLRAAVTEFEHFQQLMRSRSRYDFDDMMNWVIKAFEENKSLLNRYQEQFLYILVDEYQDTSGTQNRLVQLLINYWDNPNVFVVGDDDQSIYRFQGANVENMLAFAESYEKDLLTVILTNNYRSTQPILDVSKTLIDRNKERLVKKIDNLSKELLASNTKISHLAHTPQIREYETQRQEMIGITLEVEKLLAQGITAGRIGIIYKENKYGEELAQYLRLHNIPVFSKRSLNILEIPLAQKIVLLLKYLATEHDIPYSGDEMLFEILHFDWFAIPPIEIAKLSIEVADKQFSSGKTSIRRLLCERSNQPPKDLFSQGINPQLKKTNAAMEQLVADVPNVTLQTLFENIVQRAGVLSCIMQSAERIWLLQVLTGLFDFVKEETRRNPLLNLKQLVNIIELMEKEEITLPLIQISGSDKGVNLLTAHGSKGLEFEYVFFVGCSAGCWEKKRKPGGGYSFPDTIFTSQPKHIEEEELRRLFYVALTRAEQHLIISYVRFNNDGREMDPSMFIAEIMEQQQLPVEKVFLSEEVIAEFQALQFSEVIAPEIEKIEADFITAMLDKFVMNVTALNNYLRCPLEFYFKNLIRIPSPKNESTEFGSAVHYALECLFRKMQSNNETFPVKEEFIADFEWYMHRHRESFTQEQFNRRMEYGQEVLSNYYDNYYHTWNKIVAIERNIKNVVVNGVPLKGKLDKLEFFGKEVNVVDYKTGDPEKAKPKLLAPCDIEPNGGDYWRQAVFYKILVDNYTRQWQVVSTEFDFVEPDKKKDYQKRKVVITPEDITTVKEQIVVVWQKIQNREFYTGCGKEDCHWCNFVKTNNLAVALHEVNEEEETEL